MKNLLTAMNAVMSEVGYVQKGKKNAFHGYKYAGEADLLEALRPALVKHGLLLIPSTDGAPVIDEHGNTHVVMSYTLAHISGEVWPHPLRMPGCGGDKNKNGVGDKGTYKAITGANKYLLFKLFQIETGDDPEQEHVETGEPQRAAQAPVQRAEATPSPSSSAATSQDMLREQYKRIMQAISEARTVKLIDEILTVNRSYIEAIREQSAEAGERIDHAAENRKGELALAA